MEIQFYGSVREVTGSMHLLTVAGKKILLECGFYQGKRQESIEKNRRFPFEPGSVDVVVLSHAHIDHSGNIPQMVKQGYRGSIYCTHATHDLASIMLRDAAHIQEKDAEYLNKRIKKDGKPTIVPLYTMEDSENALRQFIGIGYGRPFFVTSDVQVTFFDAGHILGSAIVQIDVKENGRSGRIVFTGDLGRKNLPVIQNPFQLHTADVYITESTYGNKKHDAIGDMKSKLRDVVHETVGRGGKIVIPAFSVGRTQEIVYFLHSLFDEKALPEISIFVDSPLSVNATEVFRMHTECFDQETKQKFLDNREDPFGFHLLQYIQTAEESKRLNDFKGSCIIISASGMCETGRILHHLAHTVSDPKNTILIVSFMAANTLGRRIVERQPVVRIFGEDHPLRAQVSILNGFSAHADHDELLEYFGGLDRNRLKQVFVIHGESEQSEALATGIREKGMNRVVIPVEGEKNPING
jgi:metallo-beta-lactamase family protein